MEFHLRIWSLGFTSIAIGALATLALCLGVAQGARPLRLALVLSCLSAICGMATHGPFLLLVIPWAVKLQWSLGAVGESLVGLLWLSVMILFEDAPITPLRLAPTAVLFLVSFASRMNGPNGGVFGWVATAINLALAAHVFVCVAKGWRGDLVEKRRRLRRPLLLALGVALVLVLIVQGVIVAGAARIAGEDLLTLTTALLDVAVAVATIAAGALFLEPRASLLAEPGPRPSRETDDRADDTALAKLEHLMTEGQVWRREGLTVGALANDVGMPEHRLRLLINGRLGHRNFAAFINTRRIDAARRLLADAAFGGTPISKVAYDHGFSSLGPFNRAFKDATGVTPTQWRRSQ